MDLFEIIGLVRKSKYEKLVSDFQTLKQRYDDSLIGINDKIHLIRPENHEEIIVELKSKYDKIVVAFDQSQLDIVEVKNPGLEPQYVHLMVDRSVRKLGLEDRLIVTSPRSVLLHKKGK